MSFSRPYRGGRGFPSGNPFPPNGGNNNGWHTTTFEQAAQRMGYGPEHHRGLFPIFREAEMFGIIRKAQGGLYLFHPEFFERLGKRNGGGGGRLPGAGGFPSGGGYPGGGSGFPGVGAYPGAGEFSRFGGGFR